MSKITSKLQVTIPKAIAEQYGITPGDDVEFVPAGPSIRMVQSTTDCSSADASERLRLFDASVERQRVRERARAWGPATAAEERGWTRDELYEDRPRKWRP